MGIKEAHRHDDGTVCFAVRSIHPLTKQGVFLFGGEVLTGGFMGYCGQWKFFEPGTGKEVASMRGGPFGRDDIVEAMRVGNLVEDPDCVP